MARFALRALPFLLLVPALLPLIYADGLLYPYLMLKTVLFRAAGVLVLASLAYLILSGSPLYYARLRNKLTWAPLLFLAVAYLSSAFGTDFYRSFWSTFERGDGLLTLTVLVVFFYATLLSANERFLQWFYKTTAVVASLVALFGILQWIETATGWNIPLIASPSGRIGSTLGNAAYMASYLSLAFFATVAAWRSAGKGIWKHALGVGALLQVLAVFLSATRGSLLALALACVVVCVYGVWKGEGRSRLVSASGLALIILAAGLFFGFRDYLQTVPLDPIRRIASVSLSDATTASRLFLWEHMGARIAEHPLLGVGAEHTEVVFNEVYNPAQIREEWFDRSHNAFLDYALQFGLIGCAVYLGLLVSFALLALRVWRGGREEGALALLVLLVYAIQNAFLFDTALVLWLLLALLASLLSAVSDSSASRASRLPAPIAPIVAALVSILIFPISVSPLIANAELARGYLYHLADVRVANESIEKGWERGTYADLEYGYQLYEMYANRQATQLSGEERLMTYQLAEKVLRANYEAYPYDGRTAVYFAHVLDLAPPEVPRDEELERAVLGRAIEISPLRLQPWYILANISIRKGDQAKSPAEKKKYYDEGIGVLAEYAKRAPSNPEPHFISAALYLAAGERDAAAKSAEEGLSRYRPNAVVARRAVRYYLQVGDWAHAKLFTEDILAAEPENAGVRYDLAKLEYLLGNESRARELFEEVRAEEPSVLASDPAFLRAMEEGE